MEQTYHSNDVQSAKNGTLLQQSNLKGDILRKAFTMVELIFVIVILAILGAVAIPKLNATRNDAINATIAQNIMTGAGEIASYAMSHGQTTADLSLMSHAISSMMPEQAVVDSGNHKVNFPRGSINDCVSIRVDVGINEENLTMSSGNAGSDSDCLGLQKLIDFTIYPMVLRGKQVDY